MKFSLKQDTLAFQLSRPALVPRDMSEAWTPSVGAACKQFRETSPAYYLGVISKEDSKGSPENDAIVFYMLNHASAVVRQRVGLYDPLGPYLPIMEEYNKVLAVRTLRMFFYLLLICTRESRHRGNSNDSVVMNKLRATYGDSIADFNNSIRGIGSEPAANSFCVNPPKATLGSYTKFLSDVFYQGSYSGGYGGKAWGKVADVLRDFVHGKLSAEMMMDTAFTLCHNNGPIFNKGMLFSSYGPEIYKILDVQRAGMIPQYVASKKVAAGVTEQSSVWTLCYHALGDCFKGHVDWYAVEKLGALKTYTSEKAEQVKLYGVPDGTQAQKIIDTVKSQIIKDKVADEESKYITLHPGCKIKMIGRNE